MKYSVYTIRHIGTGNVLYVGYTNDFDRRMYDHLTLRTNTARYIEEVGCCNIDIEVVAEFNDKKEAKVYEDELICKYNTIEYGWNTVRSGYRIKERKKVCDARYRQTEHYKAYQAEYQSEYHKSEKYKAYQAEYRKKNKDILLKRQQTPEFKAYKKAYYQRRKAEKLEKMLPN